MKDIRDIEEMIYVLHNKLRHLTKWTYKWQGENEAMFRDITARLEALEKRTQESDHRLHIQDL